MRYNIYMKIKNTGEDSLARAFKELCLKKVSKRKYIYDCGWIMGNILQNDKINFDLCREIQKFVIEEFDNLEV